MSAIGLFIAALALSALLGLALVTLIWNENDREAMSREDAERRARRDTDETSAGDTHSNWE